MSTKKTAWHPPFTGLLQERCPRWAKVSGEVQLTTEPLRVDDVVEVWADRPHDPNDTGSTLRGMWRFIVVVGLLEYKSVVWPFQHGDLSRLIAYGMLWRATHQRRESLPDGSRTERLAAHEVTLFLAVPSINTALREELDDLGLLLPASNTGYYQISGALLPLVIIDLRAVAELEDDDLLRAFAGLRQHTVEGRRWVRQHWSVKGDPMSTSTSATPDLYGYDEFIEQQLQDLTPEQRLKGLAPEERLAGLAPEERLAGLAPAERLAGLAPAERLAGLAPAERLAGLAPAERLAGLAPAERLAGLAPAERLAGLAPAERLKDLSKAEQVLALPDDLLRFLPDDYIATLPEDVRAMVRARRETGG
jgi:hypothetical protein